MRADLVGFFDQILIKAQIERVEIFSFNVFLTKILINNKDWTI